MSEIESSAETLEAVDTMPVNAVADAVRSLATAQDRQRAIMSGVAEAEARMRELQQQAEETQLAVVEAEAEAVGAATQLQVFVQEEELAKFAYQEALDILAEAEKLVAETLDKCRMAEKRRSQKEQEFVPTFVELGVVKTTQERFLALADVEGAKLRREMAGAEEEVSMARVKVCDARLNLLKDPASLLRWPEIKVLLEGGL